MSQTIHLCAMVARHFCANAAEDAEWERIAETFREQLLLAKTEHDVMRAEVARLTDQLDRVRKYNREFFCGETACASIQRILKAKP